MVAQPQQLCPPNDEPGFESRQSQQQQQQQGRLLLCCVCHEHNTTFRYEVVYKTASGSLAPLALKHQLPPAVVTVQPVCPGPHYEPARITELTEDGEELLDPSQIQDTTASDQCRTLSLCDSQSHEYYNFPPKHPRHGHLKWPVWTPTPSPVPNGSLAQPSFVATYPDYPIHIPTVTLKRISASAKKGNKHLALSVIICSFYRWSLRPMGERWVIRKGSRFEPLTLFILKCF